LEPPQAEQGNEIAHMQAVGRRVEASIERERPRGQAFLELTHVRAVLDQMAPLQILKKVHGIRQIERGIYRGGGGPAQGETVLFKWPKALNRKKLQVLRLARPT